MPGPFDDLIPDKKRDNQGYYTIQGPPIDPAIQQQRDLSNDATRGQIVKNQQDIANNPLQRENLQTNVAQGHQSLRNNNVSVSTDLQSKFRSDPVVQAYREAAPNIRQMLAARPGGEGDLSVIYGWAKTMDPTGSVREGDTDLAKSVSPIAQRAALLAQQVKSGNFLPPEVRAGLIEEARSKGKALHDQYSEVLGSYRNLAAQNGIDPSILGVDEATRDDKDEASYIRAHGGTPKVNGVPIDAPPPERTTTEGVFGNPDAPKSLPGAEDYRTALYGAMKSKQISNYKDAVSFTDQFNANYGTHIPYPKSGKSFFNAVAAARSGKAFDVELPKYDARTQKIVDERKAKGTHGGVDPFGAGAGDAITLGAGDEIAAFGDAFRGAMKGEGAFGDLYGVNADANRITNDFLRSTNPLAYGGGQLAGSLALPSFGATTPAELARLGAGMGGVYGFNSGEGGIGNRAAQGVEGAAAGAALGYAIPKGLSMIPRRARGGIDAASEAAAMRQEQIAAAQGAQDLGIQMPRFVAGGPTAQKFGAIADQSQFGAPVVRRSARAMLDQSEAARNDIASSIGTPLDPESMGDVAIAGGKAANKAKRSSTSRLFSQAEQLSGDTRVPLPNAKAVAQAQIAELSDTPGGVEPKILGTLNNIAQNLDGEWTPAGIRRMRTEISNRFVEAGMAPGDASRRAQMITSAAEQDMISGLRAAGKPKAAATWQRAAQSHADRMAMVENVLQPILGANKEKTGAEVARGLTAAFKSNPNRARNFIAALPEEQANTIRASVIAQMGNPGSGGQDLAGEAFSLSQFLTHWNDIKQVRNGIFDPKTVTALNKLAAVAERAKAAGHVENHSNTGSINIALMTGGPAISAPGLLFSGHPAAAAGAVLTSIGLALAQHGGAALLASPKFAERLAQMPLNPKSSRQFWSGQWVQKLAATNPEIREPLIAFQNRILANDNAIPGLAASPDDPDEKKRQQHPY